MHKHPIFSQEEPARLNIFCKKVNKNRVFARTLLSAVYVFEYAGFYCYFLYDYFVKKRIEDSID